MKRSHCLAFALSILSLSSALAEVHIVSPSDDVRRIRAVCAGLRDGDTLQFRTGVYTGLGDLVITASRITIETEPGKPAATIQQKTQPGGSWPLIVLSTPGQHDITIRRLVMRYAWCGVLIDSPTLPRVANVRIQDCDFYGFEKSGIRTQHYGVEYLYLRNIRASNCLGTEGGVDIRLHEGNYERGAGSRWILVYGCQFVGNQHQQAGGIIFQEQTENWIVMHSRASGNGEQAFCSKAGGFNALINSVGYANGKCALLYARDPHKTFEKNKVVIGEIPSGEPTDYLVMGCTAIGRHYLSGDQGGLHLWPNVRVWAYNSTFMSLRKPDGKFTAAPVTIQSDPGRSSRLFMKNCLLYRTSNGPLVNAYQNTELTTYIAVRNAYWSPDGRLYRTHLKRDALGPDFAEVYPVTTEPVFMLFDPECEDDIQHLRPAAGSPLVGAGQAYGESEDDWPAQAARLIRHWREFEGFTCLSSIERRQLIKQITQAHLRDRNNVPRDPLAPTIGGLE